MNSLKKSMRLAKIFAFALSFLMFCFPTAAMAATNTFTDAVEECVPIQGGGFSVNVSGLVPSPQTIRAAVVLLPDGETGTVDNIVITGPDGQLEFGCKDIEIQNGIDLIQRCGGPANLKQGSTSYEAKGSDFAPNPMTSFCINLDT
jgi:hypothetical protein